jgi:phosphohistidine swiveling domain-containing protein
VDKSTRNSPSSGDDLTFEVLKRMRDIPPGQLGCKGQRVYDLEKLNLGVPDTWVVPTAFQQQVASANAIKSVEDWTRVKRIPEVLLRDIGRLFAAHPNTKWVIRSSATTEDDHFASSAGAYDTFMHIDTVERATHALVTIFGRLGDRHIIEYLRRRNLFAENQQMGVLVQRQVRTVHAGVCFTRSPLEPEFVRVEHCTGYGTPIVDGTGTPLVVLARRIGGDGVEIEEPADAPEFVKQSIRGALSIERAFGGAQDIEWGWDNERVVFFQARDAPAIAPLPPRVFAVTHRNECRHTTSVSPIGHGVAVGQLVSVKHDRDADECLLGSIFVLDGQQTGRTQAPTALVQHVSALASPTGGHLSHLAVVARELGVPIVRGTLGDELEMGAVVVLDADAGLVTRLSDVPPVRQKELIFDAVRNYAHRPGSLAKMKFVNEAVITDRPALRVAWKTLSARHGVPDQFVQEIHPYDLRDAVYCGIGARLQTEPGVQRLQFKRAQAGQGRWRRDEEFHLVTDRTLGHDILTRMGYIPRPSQQRALVRWSVGGATFQFNLWPNASGPYLGIEAPDVATIENALRLAGLDQTVAQPLDGVDLFAQFGISLQNCTFVDAIPAVSGWLE